MLFFSAPSSPPLPGANEELRSVFGTCRKCHPTSPSGPFDLYRFLDLSETRLQLYRRRLLQPMPLKFQAIQVHLYIIPDRSVKRRSAILARDTRRSRPRPRSGKCSPGARIRSSTYLRRRMPPRQHGKPSKKDSCRFSLSLPEARLCAHVCGAYFSEHPRPF